MTTAEIIGPMVINGMFAVFGAFATVASSVVKDRTILDTNKPKSEFKKRPAQNPRKVFLLFFMLTPFIVGSMWGLIYTGAFKQIFSELIAYAIAIILGVASNSIVLKINSMSIKEFVDIIKNIIMRTNA